MSVTQRARRLSARDVAFAMICGATFTLPFEFTKAWSPISWIEFSRVFMLCAMGATAWTFARDRSGLRMTGLLAAAALMIAADLISRLVHPQAGTLKDLFAALAYFGFAVTVGWNVQHMRQIRLLALAVLASVAIVATVSILEEVFNFYLWNSGVLGILGRRNSTLADPNVTARVLSIGLLVLVGLVASRRRWGWRAMAGATALGIALGMAEALTQSRAMWFFTAAALIVWIPLALFRRFAFVPMAAFAFGMVALLLFSPSVASRAATMPLPGQPTNVTGHPSVREGTTYGPPTPIDPLLRKLPLDDVRTYLIRAGVEMWLANPVIGVGFSGYENAIKGQYWAYVPPDRRNNATTLPHTDAVRVLAETGLVGFAAYLLFLGAFVLMAIRTLRKSGRRGAVGLVLLTGFGIIVLASQFEGRFTSEPYLWLLVGVGLALQAIHRRQSLAAGPAPASIEVPSEGSTTIAG
jgi:O-antigen ligase